MQAIDWSAPATLIERSDGGSDLHYDFRTVGSGSLGQLVRQVAGMDAGSRARLVIDCQSQSLGVSEILALAQRDDLP